MTDMQFSLHGHFYQPPREDPRSGRMATEVSAAPFHDWNERITAECYRPNAWARITDDRGLIVGIVNNFELMSFDLAPTLARWMAENAPDVLERIIDADRRAGTAVAHPFHHVILPFADERDRRTELRWGRAEFVHRFGREPTGVWLPETAMDSDTIATVAAEGLGFTIALPHQVTGAQALVADHRGCRIVVADDVLSRRLAFGVFGGLADAVVDAAAQSAAARGHAIATTDGETFGHHHKYTERTIAYALGVEAPRRGWKVGRLDDLVAETRHVDVGVAPSAWSCAHGLERWRSDCGCRNGEFGNLDQRWRAPLRHGLEAVRDIAAGVFVERGAEVFTNPWAARDDYATVLCDLERTDAYLAAHLRPGASAEVALALLESQRHALGMFTSCAWFFDDIGRLESRIALRIAAECLNQLDHLGAGAAASTARSAMELHLSRTQSHDPAIGSGSAIWRTVLTADIDTTPVVRRTVDVSVLERALLTRAHDDIDRAIRWAPELTVERRDRAQEVLHDALAVGDPDDGSLDKLGATLGLASGQIRRRPAGDDVSRPRRAGAGR